MFDLTLAITSVIATFYLNILCFLPSHLCRIRCMLDMFVLLYEPIILLAHLSASYHLPFLLDQINIVAESLCTIELPMNLREVSLVSGEGSYWGRQLCSLHRCPNFTSNYREVNARLA